MAAKIDTASAASLPETADSDCIPMFEDSNLPEGWSRKVAQRLTGKTAGTFDVYLFSPDGRRLRSKSQLEEYLKETNSDLKASEFDFTVRGRNSIATPSASAAKPTAKPKPKKILTSPGPRVTLKRVSDQARHSPPTAAKKSVSEPVGRTRSSTSSSASSKSFSLPSQRRQPRTRKAANRTRAKRRIATSSVPKKSKGRDDDDDDDEDDEDQESDDEPKKADKVTRAGKRKKVDEEKRTPPPSAQKSKLRSRTSYATTANVDADSENTNDDSDSNNVAAGSESGTSMLNLSLTINGKSLWTWEWRINQALYKQLKRGGRLEKRMRKRVQKQGKDSRGKADTRGAKSQ